MSAAELGKPRETRERIQRARPLLALDPDVLDRWPRKRMHRAQVELKEKEKRTRLIYPERVQIVHEILIVRERAGELEHRLKATVYR